MIKKTREMKTIQFTKEELKQLDRALGNCWGNGDWLEGLDIQGGKAEEKAFISPWMKLVKQLSQSKPIAL